ncbi:hypothetical protein GOODEAATRI_010743 [Goodea atripinnis]|uniref:Uncharacterized protein n=1 Tax=Goodea atripinnis TaxID=208336 RepID=A0ABV0MR42_9TELE
MFYRITMTLTREAHCLIFYKVSAAMSDHMRRSHFITDLQERRMLLNLSSGHVNVRNSPGCTYKTGCLDQHKQFAHPDLSADLRESYMQSDRKAKTVFMLQDLRKTEPSPPMVSGLDNDDKGNAIFFRRVSRVSAATAASLFNKEIEIIREICRYSERNTGCCTGASTCGGSQAARARNNLIQLHQQPGGNFQ